MDKLVQYFKIISSVKSLLINGSSGENDPRRTYKYVAKWLHDKRVKMLEWRTF